MGDFDESFTDTLKTQSWALYAVGMFLICLRMYARCHRLGIRSLQADDYLMMLAAALYTGLIITLNAVAQGGGSNLFPKEMLGTFTPEEIEERIYGSKVVVVSEQMMLMVIYVLKACVLILYTRLTLGLHAQRWVRYIAYYVVCGFVGTEIAFFTACRPSFQSYWSMPPTDDQCATLEHYAIVQGSLNISSDALMLCIPLPLIRKMAMPVKQKLVLFFLFSLGFFVIIAAVMTKVFNLKDMFDPVYMLWYVREASVAVYVANLPSIWPLLREWFPCLRGLTPGGGTSSGLGANNSTLTGRGGRGAKNGNSKSGGGGSTTLRNNTNTMVSKVTRGGRRRGGRESLGSLDSDLELKDIGSGDGGHRKKREVISDSSSTEQIVGPVEMENRDVIVNEADVTDAQSRGSNNTSHGQQQYSYHHGQQSTGLGFGGGITVERTIVVEAVEVRQGHLNNADYDVERGIFGWQGSVVGQGRQTPAR
ncbi:hypothetical protein QBC46DRAFT_357189 [Diplogelasinospora grovesii]|uniref:Rhodopsin domain-containing protein n=1 Tax=Diplogelasinospora grovesii TaxID=303347 RepID=A0AAN6S1A2_9PEZI|nr:hypothetical protein QBC46DRAFT_357189 [Diplogelasinospora grovesii]